MTEKLNHDTIRLLLIEDNPGDALLLREQLAGVSERDLRVTHAASLQAGLHLVQEQQFDAILLDLALPDSEGLRGLENLQGLAGTLPIIIVTGGMDEDVADNAIRRGAQDYLVKGTLDGRSVVRSIRYAIDRKKAEEALRKSEEALRKAHNELERLASTDPLTGLYNRRHFVQLAESEVGRSRRYGHSLAAIMLDIDHFKQVNDIYGHGAGDKVLVLVAECCRRQLRSGDTAGRYGGDEFVIVLPESGLPAAEQFAERFRLRVMQESIDLEQNLTVTVSLGVAALQGEGLTLEALLSRADKALYLAKRSGRNCVSSGSATNSTPNSEETDFGSTVRSK
jgi:diguanylate cyclase (GGDEF)-like protein